MTGCAAAFESARTRCTILASAGGSATSLSSGCIDFHSDGRSRAADFLGALDRHLGLVDGGRVITSAGVDRPASVHQKGMLTLEEVQARGGVDIVHFPWMRSSHPRLAVHCLRAKGITADILQADDSARTVMLERGDAETLGRALARSIPASRKDLVAIPALWAGLDLGAMLEAATREGGCEFRELVGPAGPAGLRLQRAAELVSNVSNSMIGCELRGLEFTADRCTAAIVRSGLRDIRIVCRGIILATGGPLISRSDVVLPLEKEMVTIPSLGAAAPFLQCRDGFARHAGRPLRNVVVCGSALSQLGYLEGKGAGDCLLSGLAAGKLLGEGL